MEDEFDDDELEDEVVVDDTPEAISKVSVAEAVSIEVASEVEDITQRVESRVEKILKARDTAKKGQGKQADKMLKKNKKLLNSFKIGDLVPLATEGIDRGAADAPNLLCYILAKKDISFQLGSQAGILNNWFAYNQIQSTSLATSFTIEDVPDKTVTVREAIRFLSVAHGQGVLKCGCLTGACSGGRCSCAKAEQKCNSRCHGGNPNPKCCRI